MTRTCHFRRRRPAAARQGLLTMEIAAAVALLLMVLLSLTRVLTAAASAERRLSERAERQQDAANLLRRLALLPGDELTQSRAEQLARQYAQQTGQPELTVRVQREEGSAPLTRVDVVAASSDASNSDSSMSHRLTAWYFRADRATEAVP